jgi:hypothetical protein
MFISKNNNMQFHGARGNIRDHSFFFLAILLCAYSFFILYLYHGTALPSQKNPPLGPSSGNVAAHTIPFAL